MHSEKKSYLKTLLNRDCFHWYWIFLVFFDKTVYESYFPRKSNFEFDVEVNSVALIVFQSMQKMWLMFSAAAWVSLIQLHASHHIGHIFI